MKLPATKPNLINLLLDSIKEVGWTPNKMITLAATLELENMVRVKPGQGPTWRAQRISLSNNEMVIEENDKPFREVLQEAIKSRLEDAHVLAKMSNGLMWLAVLYKVPGGALSMPINLVISTDYKYLYSKHIVPFRLIEAVKIATKCKKLETLHLTGRHVPSLNALLHGRSGKNTHHPTFQPQTPKVNDSGCDFTRGASVKNYTKQCLGNDIHLEQYTVEPSNKRWQGDGTPELQLISVASEVLFSGDVSALFAAMAAAGMCTPPFPDYIRDFAVNGRTRVSSDP